MRAFTTSSVTRLTASTRVGRPTCEPAFLNEHREDNELLIAASVVTMVNSGHEHPRHSVPGPNIERLRPTLLGCDQPTNHQHPSVINVIYLRLDGHRPGGCGGTGYLCCKPIGACPLPAASAQDEPCRVGPRTARDQVLRQRVKSNTTDGGTTAHNRIPRRPIPAKGCGVRVIPYHRADQHDCMRPRIVRHGRAEHDRREVAVGLIPPTAPIPYPGLGSSQSPRIGDQDHPLSGVVPGHLRSPTHGGPVHTATIKAQPRGAGPRPRVIELLDRL